MSAIKQVLLHGIRTVFHNKKFITLFWAFNAVSALVLTGPIFSVLMDDLSRSMISNRLTHGFDYLWYIQLRNLYEVQFSQIPLNIYFVVGVYTLIQTFFLGGLIAVFNTPEKNHTVDFFYGGVKYFSRFVKILLITVLLFAFAFITTDYLGDLITLIFKNSENVFLDFILKALRYIFLVFFIGVVTLISDYTKVSLAVKDKTDILKELYLTLIFLKNNFNKVFFVFLIVAVIGALGVVVYNIIDKVIPRTPLYFMALTFFLQQMLIIFRLFVRMLFCSTEVNLFKDLSADVVKVDA
ncbi:MAG: hypothetical protein AB1775_14530 [Bacteroidota bacterium]